MRHAILATLVAAGAGAAASPELPGCGRSGDTVRYREITESEVTLYTPGGTRLLDVGHDATITLAFGISDSITAWYDTLALKVESLTGGRRPATSALLRQPFHLRCDAPGRLVTLRAPTIPPDIREVTDLSQQFADFLVRVPPGVLRVGAAWTDTLEYAVPAAAGAFRKYSAITTWQVQQDTAVGGGRGWILTGRGRIRTEAGNALTGGRGQATVELAGEERGRAVLAPDGRMLSRTRQGDLTGRLSIRSGASANDFSQDYTYESRLTHVP